MVFWNQHEEFSPDFLAQHHDFRVYDLFHQIQALLLYPLNCACENICTCAGLREKIVLSLNVDLYNQAQARQETPDRLYAMKFLFRIPDDCFFRMNYGQSYPLWLIQQEFHAKGIPLGIVARLVETLLRLAKTYEVSVFREPRASIKEAVDLILGKMPLKVKDRKQVTFPYLGGEKAYGTHFNVYKPLCHFVTAFQLINTENFSFQTPEEIQRYLSLSHWVRKKLLSIQTPNVKQKSLFLENALLSLPPWVKSGGVDIALSPFDHKLQELNARAQKFR